MNAERKARLLHMFNDAAPISRMLGMRLSFTPEGNAVVDLPYNPCLLYTSPSPRDRTRYRMPSSA